MPLDQVLDAGLRHRRTLLTRERRERAGPGGEHRGARAQAELRTCGEEGLRVDRGSPREQRRYSHDEIDERGAARLAGRKAALDDLRGEHCQPAPLVGARVDRGCRVTVDREHDAGAPSSTAYSPSATSLPARGRRTLKRSSAPGPSELQKLEHARYRLQHTLDLTRAPGAQTL